MNQLLSALPEILSVSLQRPLSEWWAYSCNNGSQDLDRLSFHLDTRYEVQINRIRHSNGHHCHACNMLSLILLNGYGWWLQQYGASKPIFLFAAEGSLITMEPEDTHWIPPVNPESVSLCVFDKQSDWNQYYCQNTPLPESEAQLLLLAAKSQIRRIQRETLQVQ